MILKYYLVTFVLPSFLKFNVFKNGNEFGIRTEILITSKTKRICLLWCKGRVHRIIFIRYSHTQKIENPNTSKPKDLNRIVKIG